MNTPASTGADSHKRKTNPGVFISGLGAVSAAGADTARNIENMLAGRRNPVAHPTLFETPLKAPAFEAASLPEIYDLPGARTLGLALAALDEALQEAGITFPLESTLRVGVVLGTTVASQLNDIDFYRSWRTDRESTPLEPVERFIKGNLAEAILERLGLREGHAITVVNACSSGADAAGIALDWLRSGLCDLAITGGADELNRVPFAGFNSLGIMSPTLCCPFDRERSGLNLGEGAGILVLETEESLKRRGRPLPALKLSGFGAAADAHHLTAPHPEGRGLKIAIERALSGAGLTPEDITFINAHGTATRDNDQVEGRVFRDIFGPRTLVSATKGYTGHTLGAAGGLEAVFTAACLSAGELPPSAGFASEDPEIGLRPVSERTPIPAGKPLAALSTSLAFGGNNAALVITKTGGEGQAA